MPFAWILVCCAGFVVILCTLDSSNLALKIIKKPARFLDKNFIYFGWVFELEMLGNREIWQDLT
ncbi:hypothetical protein BA723_00535 [Helicobacter sp. CLO-3]|nr:hypothetical protein BA723_00535 [Helicobacter sp. CLO-3]